MNYEEVSKPEQPSYSEVGQPSEQASPNIANVHVLISSLHTIINEYTQSIYVEIKQPS